MAANSNPAFFDTIYRSLYPLATDTRARTNHFAPDFPIDIYDVIGQFDNKTKLRQVLSSNAVPASAFSTAAPAQLELTPGAQANATWEAALFAALYNPIHARRETLNCLAPDFYRFMRQVVRDAFAGLHASMLAAFIPLPAERASADALALLERRVLEVDPRGLSLDAYLVAIKTVIDATLLPVQVAPKKVFFDAYHVYFIFLYMWKHAEPSAKYSLNTKLLCLVSMLFFLSKLLLALTGGDTVKQSNSYTTMITVLEKVTASFTGAGGAGLVNFYTATQQLSARNVMDADHLHQLSKAIDQNRNKLAAMAMNQTTNEVRLRRTRFWYWVTFVLFWVTLVGGGALLALYAYKVLPPNPAVYYGAHGAVVALVAVASVVWVIRSI
jgi:hypothetical protein